MPEPPENHHDVSVTQPINIHLKNIKEKVEPVAWYLRPEVLDIFKWFVGTVCLGVFGIILNCHIQTNENIRQSRKDSTDIVVNGIEADAKVIEAISTKFDTRPIIQIKYLTYIKPFVKTKQLQDSIAAVIYRYYHPQGIKAALADINTNQSVPADLTTQQVNVLKADQPVKTAALKAQGNIIPDEKKIAPRLPVFNNDAIVDKIKDIRQASVPVVLDNYVIASNPQTLWCKKGYYVVFNNALKIGIIDLNPSGIHMVVTDTTHQKEVILDADKELLVGTHIDIISDDKNIKYLVACDYIGNAGANPFKKAAYITVTAYRKAALR